MDAAAASGTTGHKFGTFAGVYTPSILTIFGLILYLRSGWVVGQAGLINALIILCVAQGIVLITAFSISTLATNTQVKSGGAYFLISRSLGPGFGVAVGLTLALTQCVSVPFYLFGFAEAMVNDATIINMVNAVVHFFNAEAPVVDLRNYFCEICMTMGVITFIVVYIGASFAIKLQYFIMAALGLSILAFLIGLGIYFSPETLKANLHALTEAQGLALNPPSMPVPPVTLFAIFFPAVTGIMVGVNMSGDLRDANKSIPRGILWAVFTSFIVYGLQMVLFAGYTPTAGADPTMLSRVELIQSPYDVLMKTVLFGATFIITIGVICALLSSALSSLMVAPRIFQSVAMDKILGILSPFSKGVGEHNEPRRAMIVMGVIMFGFLYWGGTQPLEKDGMSPALNAISQIVTMFFLYSYCLVNVAAGVECFSNNPSFRPQFKLKHWSIPISGAVLCFVTSFMINGIASLIALIVILAIYFWINRVERHVSFSDSRQGFAYSQIRTNLRFLANAAEDHKNWRPSITILSRTPYATRQIAAYARKFEGNAGIITLASFAFGPSETDEAKREEAMRLFAEQDIDIHPMVIYASDYDTALPIFLQSHAIGPLRPNVIMQGMPHEPSRYLIFAKHLHLMTNLGFHSLTALTPLPVDSPKSGRIDIWWDSERNGALMLTFAYLATTLQKRKEKLRIRIYLPYAPDTLAFPPAEHHHHALTPLRHLLSAARIQAELIAVPVHRPDDLFDWPIVERSKTASIVLLPAQIGSMPDETADFFMKSRNTYEGTLPPAFFVNAVTTLDLSV